MQVQRVQFNTSLTQTLGVNINQRARKKKVAFKGNKQNDTFIKSNEDWVCLRDLLNQDRWLYRTNISKRESNIIKRAIPVFNEQHFTFEDYQNLTPKEKLIIRMINKIGTNDYSHSYKDLSIQKYAQRLLKLAQESKNHLDSKYPNGYKLVSIGNSLAPLTETMQLLGADTVTLPFSIQILENVFPFENQCFNKHTLYKVEDWKNYFKFHGIEQEFSKNTGKTLLFTDYVCEGRTKKAIKRILEGLNFDMTKTEFLYEGNLFPRKVICPDFDLSDALDHSELKQFSLKNSPKDVKWNIDVIKHPEYIAEQPEKLAAKLLRFALYDLLAEKKLKMFI
jgi:hypothetical protein